MSLQTPGLVLRPYCNMENQESKPDTGNAAMEATPQPQPSPQPQDRKVLAYNLRKDLLTPLYNLTRPRISLDRLIKDYKVSSIRNLDFYTGQVEDDATSQLSSQFLMPAAREDTVAWLEATDVRSYRDDLGQLSNLNSRKTTAKCFWDVIRIHLSSSGENATISSFLESCTNWGAIDLSSGGRFIQQYGCNNQEWQVEAALRSHTKPPGPWHCWRDDPPPLDPEVPHVTVAMIDVARIRENYISVGEMVVLIYFCLCASKLPMYHEHTLFPVTLLIISNRQLRFTQCIYNVKDDTFEIRKTPIVNFKNGIWEDKENEYLSVLGWMTGKPVGNTK